MKRSRFSEEQIIGILKEHEAGVSVADLCRKHGVSDASIYKWKAKFGGMDVSEAKRLRTLEDENTRLKFGEFDQQAAYQLSGKQDKWPSHAVVVRCFGEPGIRRGLGQGVSGANARRGRRDARCRAACRRRCSPAPMK